MPGLNGLQGPPERLRNCVVDLRQEGGQLFPDRRPMNLLRVDEGPRHRHELRQGDVRILVREGLWQMGDPLPYLVEREGDGVTKGDIMEEMIFVTAFSEVGDNKRFGVDEFEAVSRRKLCRIHTMIMGQLRDGSSTSVPSPCGLQFPQSTF